VEEGKINSFYGDYEYYLEKKKLLADGENPLISPGIIPHSPVPAPKEDRQLRRQEGKHRQREERQKQKLLAEIEAEIGKLERAMAEQEKKMADPAFFADHEAARQGGEKHALLSSRIAGLYAEWEKQQ